MSKDNERRSRLTPLFGQSVNVKILESLLYMQIEEAREQKPIWNNLSEIARLANISKSSAKRILDALLEKEFVEEKTIKTHASNPPRMFRLNSSNNAIRELIFFYKKVRGFL